MPLFCLPQTPKGALNRANGSPFRGLGRKCNVVFSSEIVILRNEGSEF